MKEISILFTCHERRIASQTIRFYDLKFTHVAIDFSSMSHDIQWIHKGSSCILLRSSMSKVSCLKIHNNRKAISSSFVTKEKIIFNRRSKKNNAIRQIRLNDRLNINADLQINIPDLEVAYYLPMRDLRSCNISDSSIKCVTCLYELHVIQLFIVQLTASKFRRQFWSSKRQGLRFLFQLKDNWFSNNLFIKFL